ncbi:MAG TPA: ABC transporter ATP-binding protein/permease [Kineosporiaceae bacterium]
MNGSLNWASEWATSLVWIGKVFTAAVAGILVVGWFLLRFTTWGRQFRVVGLPFFRPHRNPASWLPLAISSLVLLAAVTAVRVNVLLSFSTNGLYTAMQQLNPAGFAYFLSVFGVLATVHVVRTMLDYLVTRTLVIRWRVWLNDRVVTDWLTGHAYHRSRFLSETVDNPDQRIQVDVDSFTSTSADLAIGTITSLISLTSFSVILWQLSGPLTLGTFQLPRAMIFIAYLYVIVASVLAFRIGRPLIRLDFMSEKLNGSFRYALVRLRENSEPIAFHRGENAERRILDAQFGEVIRNSWRTAFRSLKFQGFNLVISQISVVVPLILQAPRFFARAITLGDIQQTASAFDQVHNSLSFFRNSYDTFAGYRAVLERLAGLLEAHRQARDLPTVGLHDGPGLLVRGLTVRTPDGQALVTDLTLKLIPGDALIVKGVSGVGKTTLLRALAELWPFATGDVHRPQAADALFLSQQPYIPLGTLRTALAYPNQSAALDDDRATTVLHAVQLGHLASRLDDDADWARRLSPGEQQRLAFARALITRPRIVFLDEATSAVDEGGEARLYQLLRGYLPHAVLVSVGHRSTLDHLHDGYLQILEGGRWLASEHYLWDGALPSAAVGVV